jgi:hypothetical protein
VVAFAMLAFFIFVEMNLSFFFFMASDFTSFEEIPSSPAPEL